MRAFYSLWPNYEFIDKFKGGIDTILVTAHDLPFEKESGYYDSKAVVEETIRRYSHYNVFLVPLWIRDPIYYDIPEDQQWVGVNGNKIKETPCPLNLDYIHSRVLPVMDFAKRNRCQGIIWDLEHLGYHLNPPDNLPFYTSWSPSYKCYCDECSKYSTGDMWKAHANLIWNLLNQSGIPYHGQMPYSSGWTMRQYPGKLLHFTEETYNKNISCWEWKKWKRSYKKYKVDPTILPGIWCEFKKTEKHLINYIKKLYKKYGHFWLYSHVFFGNFIPNPHVDFPNPGPATDWFFRELLKI